MTYPPGFKLPDSICWEYHEMLLQYMKLRPKEIRMKLLVDIM